MGSETPCTYDCFTFCNELDLLEIRLAELSDQIDRFVLVEATSTYTGAPKPLYFADNKARFRPYLDRIVHVVVDDLPAGDVSPWVREAIQRDAIGRGLAQARPRDRILVSDVDEIPKPAALRAALALPWLERRLIGFWCVNYLHRLNLRHDYDHRLGPRLICYGNLTSPQRLREFSLQVSKRAWAKKINAGLVMIRILKSFRTVLWSTIMRDAAWHFTSIGTFDEWRRKLAAVAHAPDVSWDEVTPENFQARMSSCRKEDMAFLPMTVRNNQQRYVHLLA